MARIFFGQAVDNVVATGILTEGRGPVQPTVTLTKAIQVADGHAAIISAAAKAINDTTGNDRVTVLLPHSVAIVARTVYFAVKEADAIQAGFSASKLSSNQAQKFSSCLAALDEFAMAVHGAQNRVVVADSRELWRLQLAIGPDTSITAGQQVTIETRDGINSKRKQLFCVELDCRVYSAGLTLIEQCPHIVEQSGKDWFIGRMMRVGDQYVTANEALAMVRRGEWVPETNGAVTRINQMILVQLVSGQLQKNVFTGAATYSA